MPKKPTGRIGPIVVRHPNSKKISGWQRINFSGKKHEIEDYFCRAFIERAPSLGLSVSSCQRNDDDGFDYTLSLHGGDVYLELTEFVLKKYGEQDNGSFVTTLSDEAQALFSTIETKSRKYSRNSRIYLLVYVTDWVSALGEESVILVKHLLAKSPPVFEKVFLYVPLDQVDGNLKRLYPSPKRFLYLDPNYFKNRRIIKPNPQLGEFLWEKS